MIKREKVITYVMIVLFVLLLVKSFVIDPYAPKNEAEQAFFDEADTIMAERYTGFIYEKLIVYPRIVKISEMSERERTVTDDSGDTYEVTGVYKAKIRKYLFGFLPFSEEKILDLD